MHARRKLAVLAAVICVAAASLTSSQKPTTIPVTSTLYDLDLSSLQLLTHSDDYDPSVCGGNCATYQTSGASATAPDLSSYITSDGKMWTILLGRQTVRTVCLAGQSSSTPGAPSITPGCYYTNMQVYSQCFDANNNTLSLLNMPSSTTFSRCSLGVDFAYAPHTTKYYLWMGPTISGTGWATVTCNAGDYNSGTGKGACTNWSIVPNMSAADATVAKLLRPAKTGSLVYIGTYQNTFRIAVNNP